MHNWQVLLKSDIQEWLDEHNITYEPTNIKKTLLDNVKTKTYMSD